MKHILFGILSLLLLTTCDDGDIIDVSVTSDGELTLCRNNVNTFLIYDDKESPSESLSLIIPRINNEDVPYTEPTGTANPDMINIGTNLEGRFIVRTYNRILAAEELCSDIPAADLVITSELEATSGQALITVTVEDDDGDGVPTVDEDKNEDGDNDPSTNPTDTDEDGIPDYQDTDDDGDNVPTSIEINDDENLDGDNDPLTNPLDTDGDNKPDYLDSDDDNDMIPTIQEDDDDSNPYDNTSDDGMGNLIPNFRNNQATDLNNLEAELFPTNQFNRIVNVSITIVNFDLTILNTQELNFGTFSYELTVTQEISTDD